VLNGNSLYLNSGTWADVMQFPIEILSGTDAQALAKVGVFVNMLREGDFSSWTLFRPSYVRLDLDASQTIVQADLFNYKTPELV